MSGSKISQCDADGYADVCGTENAAKCRTIEDAYNDQTPPVAQAINDMWGAIPMDWKPPQLKGKEIHNICRNREIMGRDKYTETSLCDFATKLLLVKAGTDDLDKLVYWDKHTSQQNCQFLDQDYGYGGEQNEGDTARSVCERIEKKKDDLLVSTFWIGDKMYTDPSAEIWARMVDKMGAKSVNEVINRTVLSLNPKTVIKQTNECINAVTTNSSNVVTASCDIDFKELKEVMGVNLTPELMLELSKSSASNITQKSNTELVQTCQMSSKMDGLLNMQASVDNQALQKALAESSGEAASASSENYTCNDVSIDMSPCMYVHQKNCCANTVSIESSNVVNVGCNSSVDGIVQERNVRKLQTCNTMTDTTMTTDLATKVFNTTAQTAEATATGTNYTFVILGILVMLGATLFFYISYMKKYALVGIVLGVILMIAGGLFIGYYFRTRIIKGVSYQQPFSVYSDTKTDLSQKMSWGVAMELFDSSPIYKALDFYPDVNEENGQTILEGDLEDGTYSDETKVYVNYKNLPKAWSGTAVFMRDPVYTGTVTPLCKEDIPDDETCTNDNTIHVITKNKTFEEITSLYIGAGLALFGILLTVLSGVMMREAMNLEFNNPMMSSGGGWGGQGSQGGWGGQGSQGGWGGQRSQGGWGGQRSQGGWSGSTQQVLPGQTKLLPGEGGGSERWVNPSDFQFVSQSGERPIF